MIPIFHSQHQAKESGSICLAKTSPGWDWKSGCEWLHSSALRRPQRAQGGGGAAAQLRGLLQLSWRGRVFPPPPCCLGGTLWGMVNRKSQGLRNKMVADGKRLVDDGPKHPQCEPDQRWQGNSFALCSSGGFLDIDIGRFLMKIILNGSITSQASQPGRSYFPPAIWKCEMLIALCTAQYGHLETVKLLLDSGADPNIKNRCLSSLRSAFLYIWKLPIIIWWSWWLKETTKGQSKKIWYDMI